MTYLIIALTAIVSYLIGSVNFSILLSKMLSGKDIREKRFGKCGCNEYAKNIRQENGYYNTVA